MKHVLIDIEGLGKRPGCAIFELAAVHFDPLTAEILSEFEALIEPDNGWHDPETVEWHKKQGTYPMPGAAAREHAGAAFLRFTQWYEALGPVETVWSWGSIYDFPVLEAIWYEQGPASGLPWHYALPSCARQECRLAFGKDWRHGPRPRRALGDCKLAVVDLVKALDVLRPAAVGGAMASQVDCPVTQAWTHRLSMMQQSVLLTAVRGPDGLPKYGPVKMLLRWYRRCVLLSAMDRAVLKDPICEGGGSFTGPSIGFHVDGWEDVMDTIVGRYMRELDAVPHHFQMHLMHAVQILGYKHPEPLIRGWWLGVYTRLVEDMHLRPESETDLDRRLGDSREQWLERADPATVD
jgi:hypothetical protein